MVVSDSGRLSASTLDLSAHAHTYANIGGNIHNHILPPTKPHTHEKKKKEAVAHS